MGLPDKGSVVPSFQRPQVVAPKASKGPGLLREEFLYYAKVIKSIWLWTHKFVNVNLVNIKDWVIYGSFLR